MCMVHLNLTLCLAVGSSLFMLSDTGIFDTDCIVSFREVSCGDIWCHMDLTWTLVESWKAIQFHISFFFYRTSDTMIAGAGAVSFSSRRSQFYNGGYQWWCHSSQVHRCTKRDIRGYRCTTGMLLNSLCAKLVIPHSYYFLPETKCRTYFQAVTYVSVCQV